MKNLITLCMLLALASTGFAGATTTTITSQSPTFPIEVPMKRDQVISRGIVNTAHVQVLAHAPSMLYSSMTATAFTADYVHTGPSRASEILALLGSQKLVYNLANPEDDYVSVWAYCYDSNWNSLFSGGTAFKLESDGKGGWRTPAGAAQVAFDPTDRRYTVDGLVTVYFVERDENGNVANYHYLDQYDGSFYFPSYLLDRKGELYLQARDPVSGSYKTVAYDAQTGEQIPSSGAITLVSGTFNGFQSVVPQGDLIQPLAVQSYKGFGQSDLIEVEVKFEGWYRVSEMTTEGELPHTVIVWKVGESTETEVDRVAPSQVIPVYLKPGLYHLRFEWSTLKPFSTIPVWEGGKG